MANLIVTRAIAARARIKRDHLGEARATDAPLGNWYVTFLPMAERNAFVYMSSRTQLSFLMLEGERLTPEKLFISLVRGISLVLELAGYPEHVRERVMNGYRSVAFARASDLSQLGVLMATRANGSACLSRSAPTRSAPLPPMVWVVLARPSLISGESAPNSSSRVALR